MKQNNNNYYIGTLQDYGYIGRGIMEVTLEMGCEKTVREAQTSSLYAQNRDAFRFFLKWFSHFFRTFELTLCSSIGTRCGESV